MLNYKSGNIVRESFYTPEGEGVVKSVTQSGNKFTFTFECEVEGFTNMEDAKRFFTEHRLKMKNIIRKYCQFTILAKVTDGMFERKENKTVQILLKRLGYLE